MLRFLEKFCTYADEGYTDVIFVSINSAGSNTYNAVSYTHLDVYKRQYQGRGLARRLLAHAEVLARQSGMRALRLDVCVGNAPPSISPGPLICMSASAMRNPSLVSAMISSLFRVSWLIL